jgi:hypothetical protein
MSHLNFFKNGCDSTVVAVHGANNRRKAVRAGGVSLENCWKGVPFSKNGAGATVVLFHCAFGKDGNFAEHAEHKDPESYREVLIQRQSTWRCADREAPEGNYRMPHRAAQRRSARQASLTRTISYGSRFLPSSTLRHATTPSAFSVFRYFHAQE